MSDIIRRRIKQLKDMESIIMSAEEPGLLDEWQEYIKNEEDYEGVASNEDDYIEACNAFVELLTFYDFTI